MKRNLARIVSIVCTLALLLAVLPLPVLAADYSYANDQTLANGLTLHTVQTKSSSGATQRSFRFDYTPGQGVTPIVAYGNKLYGKSTINEIVNYCTNRGYTVMGAANADFFNLTTGLPTGMLINNGRLCVSDGQWNAIGILPDGTAFCGTPSLRMTFTKSDGTVGNIYGMNKSRTNSGIYLYSSDFTTTTHTTTLGTHVVLQPLDGAELRLGQPLTCQVVNVTKTSSAATIADGQFILSCDATSELEGQINTIKIGQTIVLNAFTPDTRWHDAVYTVGGGNLLMKDGQTTSSVSSTKNPLTVIGFRPDGSFSVLVNDGRQTGLSDGISTREAVQILSAEGCTNIINMDGGGSTSAVARYPGQASASLINSPSDGTARACANFLVFVNTGDRSKPESRAAVYPRNPVVLAGAQLPLTCLGYNDDYYPSGASHTGCFAVTSGGGSIDGNIFNAPKTAGTSTVGVNLNGIVSDDAVVQVVDAPATMAFTKSGSSAAISSLTLKPGETVNLDVKVTDGIRAITSQDNCFTFATTGNIGSIDANGVFTAASSNGLSGTVTATYNGKTISLAVKVGSAAPTVLQDFESAPSYSVQDLPNATSASSVVTSQPEYARYGYNALNLKYSSSAASGTVTYRSRTALAIPSGAKQLTFFASGSGSFAVDFVDAAGKVTSTPFTLSSGWHAVSLTVPSTAKTIAGFSSNLATARSGSVYIDQMVIHYTAETVDTTPPTIELQTLTEGSAMLYATIKDNGAQPVTVGMIDASIDGQSCSVFYSESTGALGLALPDDGQLHRITITVRDASYNLARASTNVGSGFTKTFADIDGHWAQKEIEYLTAKGIFSKDAKFNPQNQTTNAMAATILSRYLGLDTSKYTNVQLPFSDTASIPSWALPHVRALYQEGIMTGTTVKGVRMFQPNQPTTRAQVFTLLGRTFSRGYSYSRAPFSDYSDIPSWATNHVNLLHSLGIVNGYGNSSNVKPLQTITRAEFAALLYRVY